MQDAFWSQHLSLAEAARRLGCSRQNVHQRVNAGRIPNDVDESGKRGVPMSYVDEELLNRNKTEVVNVGG